MKFFVITGFVGSFWFFAFFLFVKAFGFLQSFPGIGGLIEERLLYIAFGILSPMLIISTAIVTYSTHYKSEELGFLLAVPLETSSVFMYKSLHAMFLSSWASIFLISPLLVAYAAKKSLGLFFYIGSFLLFPVFVVITGMVGILITVLLVGRIRGKALKVLGLVAVPLFLLFAFFLLRFQKTPMEGADIVLLTLNRILHHTKIFLFPLLPSYWLSEAIVSFARADRWESIFYSLLLLTTAAVSLILLQSAGRRIYFESWLRSRSGSKLGATPFLEKLDVLPSAFGPRTRRLYSLFLKDIKTFTRDPQQWTQALIFFGLVFVYLLNIRKMPYDIDAPFWKELLLFLNMSSIITILAMLSTRFAFPLISFEGKRFWISLVSPLSLRELVLQKFWITAAGLFLTGEILIIVLNIMLKTHTYLVLASSVIILCASLALAGLSIGIGTLFPDFREENFAKISSGFGGTVLLIVSLLYIGAIIAFSALPAFAIKETSRFYHTSFFLCGFGIISLSLFCTLVPVSLGIKSISKRDF